jgi:hypothetical protein
MPKIEVSNEIYDFLISCQEELKTQDNRSTTNVFFVNQYVDRDYANYNDDYHSDGYVWFDSGIMDSPCETDKELFEYIHDYSEETWDIIKTIYNYDIKNCDKDKEIKEWFLEMVDDSYEENLVDILESSFFDLPLKEIFDDEKFCLSSSLSLWAEIHKISYNKDYKIDESGLFSFFESDVEEHKRLNGHNFRSGTRSYGCSIQRTPKMLQLLDWLTNQNFNKKE